MSKAATRPKKQTINEQVEAYLKHHRACLARPEGETPEEMGRRFAKKALNQAYRRVMNK